MSDLFLTPKPSNENCCSPNVQSKFQKFPQNTLVAVIHVDQTKVGFTVYTAPELKYKVSANQPLKVYNPQPGWYEVDPNEIIEAIEKCIYQACRLLPSYGLIRADIKAVGVTNQRETTVVWNAWTGQPLYRAITSNDMRTADIAKTILSALPNGDQNYYKKITGLPIMHTYPAFKIQWLQDNVSEVKNAINGGFCRAGTLDSWIIWNLTRGELHITDVTNASRTFLMNIKTLEWDKEMLKAFNIDDTMLPRIHNSAEVVGTISTSLSVLHGISIGGIIDNQSAELMGQMCLHKGQTFANFNDNCNVLCNIGTKCIECDELHTTIAYKMNAQEPCVYALEGIVPYCVKSFDWLHRNLHIVSNPNKAVEAATSLHAENDLFFVPAFNGLSAPYWRKDACGMLIGLTNRTTRFHIVRAAMDAICFQVCDIVEVIKRFDECQVLCQKVIYVGGQLASNDFLMQLLADTIGLTVVRYTQNDTVSYGAAMCAGYSVNIINMQRFLQGIWRTSIEFETFVPLKKSEQRMMRYVKWRRAIKRSLNWKITEKKKIVKNENEKKKKYLLYGTIMSGIFIASLLITLRYASKFRGYKFNP